MSPGKGLRPFVKELFFRFMPSFLPGNRASILMYHSITDADYFGNVWLESFERQMQYLASTRRPVISLSELARRLEQGESLGGAVALTFDDGYRNNYTDAFPLLKRFGFPATIFVISDLIGRSDAHGLEYLSADELRDMETSGLVSIGAHTKSHPKLSALPSAVVREEIEGSKHALEEMLGKRVEAFAYPYGDFSNETMRLVKEAGFKVAVTVREGTVASGDDTFRLKRNSIDRSTTLAQFRGKISRAVDIYESLKL